MITLDLARKLKEAGLNWEPAQGDKFIIPDRGMDAQVFVINDMATVMEMLKGAPAISFHGTPEWALDYIHVGEVIWLPGEADLRDALESRLAAEGVTVYDLLFLGGTYSCRFEHRGAAVAYHAASASEAYAAALLDLLRPETG
ncbi:MAG TPA: pilus assembly protein CpaE [Anaerolineae bacterium]